MESMRSEITGSLRRRVGRWIAMAFTAAIVILTATAIAQERRLVLAIAAANGESLLAHLSTMPEFRADRATAAAHVTQLDRTLRAAGSRVELAQPSDRAPARVLARRDLALADGTLELRYAADAPWLDALLKRALAFHLLLGGAALVVLLAGTERILRARLVAPLRRFAHQVRFMGAGGGWEPKLPPSDTELAELARALEELGPALHGQVQAWIDAERRASAALALKDVRSRLRDPRQRALALLGDLQARGLVGPAAKPGIRALVREIERIGREIEAEEHARFGDTRPAADAR